MQWAQNKQGFTIVELLIVIVVIAILAAITIVGYNGVQNSAQLSALQSTAAQLGRKIEVVKTSDSSGLYPASIGTGDVAVPANTEYVYVPSDDRASFCLAIVKGTKSFVTTSSDLSAKSGGCSPSSGLVASWLFNGNANDSSASGMNGTVNGAVLTSGQNGQPNGAYSFNGTSDYIGLSGSTPINFATGSFSVNVWVNQPALPVNSTWYDILSGNGSDWSVGLTTAGSSTPILRMTRVNQYDAPRGPAVTSGWHMVTVNFASASTPLVSYYLDGVFTNTDSWNNHASASFTSATKRIGSRMGAGFFKGSIDDLRVYNRTLSASEVTSLYNAGAQ